MTIIQPPESRRERVDSYILKMISVKFRVKEIFQFLSNKRIPLPHLLGKLVSSIKKRKRNSPNNPEPNT